MPTTATPCKPSVPSSRPRLLRFEPRSQIQSGLSTGVQHDERKCFRTMGNQKPLREGKGEGSTLDTHHSCSTMGTAHGNTEVGTYESVVQQFSALSIAVRAVSGAGGNWPHKVLPAIFVDCSVLQ